MLGLISVIGSMMLLLCFRLCYLLLKKWKEWIVNEYLCVFFLLPLPHRESWMSVVFDFSDSLNDVAPIPSIIFAVSVSRTEKGVNCWRKFLYVFFLYLHNQDRVQLVLCLFSMLHSIVLLLRFQHHCLLMRRERVNCWWTSFACLLSFVFTPQIERSECCVWF